MAKSLKKGIKPEILKRDELVKRYKTLSQRAEKLEELIEVISRGKYMWESTFDAITSPVMIVSKEFEIKRANLAFADVAGKDITTIIGGRCYKIFGGRAEQCEGCPLLLSLEKDEQITSDLHHCIREHEFEVSSYPLGAHGSDSAVLSYRDITEERRLQREVVQQEKMAAIGMLAGGVAHEINNPLGGILAFVQLMKRDAKDNPSLLADLEEVERASIRCKKIVSDLLDFSRISKDRERRPIDVNVLIEKVFPFIQREIRSLNVELVFDGSPALPLIYGIPDRLQQVFLNLMTNACHAMSKGGVLTVTTEAVEEGEVIEVRVRDTGAGVPVDIREKVFDPFFTTKEPGKGTGLGLSISYRIVKEHGGQIFCEDTANGAEFVVQLPVANKKISEDTPKRE